MFQALLSEQMVRAGAPTLPESHAKAILDFVQFKYAAYSRVGAISLTILLGRYGSLNDLIADAMGRFRVEYLPGEMFVLPWHKAKVITWYSVQLKERSYKRKQADAESLEIIARLTSGDPSAHDT